ncbi:hypothetical protein [Marinilabilia rubra]|uniref:Uncharacterized protein n=1 Tax=Marinilabilia rubra TaxID=2162893 RepID=A0A2U2B919_9BACT|nr:hypothetical protein [Marinilabilia rubra]PWD99543.1 hypothetical protein DDZ16_08795 [Marinilabilia rubra]
MKTFDLEKYKDSWKSGADFTGRKLSGDQINRYLMKESNDVTRVFKRNVFFDVFLKSVVVIYWIGLQSFTSEINWVLGLVMLVISAIGMAIELRLIRKIPLIDYGQKDLQNILALKTNFLRTSLYPIAFAKGLTAPLLIISGMTGWFLQKYETVRPLDVEDFVVFGAFVLIGFILNATVEFKQQIFQINQLEATQNELKTEALKSSFLAKQKHLRWRRFWMLLMALVCGLFLLGWLLFN